MANNGYVSWGHIAKLEEERCNSSALAMELHLSCTDPSLFINKMDILIYWCSTTSLYHYKWLFLIRKQWAPIINFEGKLPSRSRVNILIDITVSDNNFSETLPGGSPSMDDPGIFLCMCPANERRRYIATSALIGWAHTQNDPWWPYQYSVSS